MREWWDDEGRLLGGPEDVAHRGGCYAVEAVDATRLLSSGKDGSIILWTLHEKMKMTMVTKLENLFEGKIPRSMTCDESGNIIVGTTGNRILSFRVTPENELSSNSPSNFQRTAVRCGCWQRIQRFLASSPAAMKIVP